MVARQGCQLGGHVRGRGLGEEVLEPVDDQEQVIMIGFTRKAAFGRVPDALPCGSGQAGLIQFGHQVSTRPGRDS
nr:hypothetical protein [Nocardiopsis lucentensis]